MLTSERRGRRRSSLWGAATVIATVVAAAVAPASASAASAARDGATRGAVPRVIVDTDLSRWWDDATAIGMVNVMAKHGQVRILGVVSDIPNPVAVAAIDAINTAYGHSHIPLGAVAGSDANTAPHGYSDVLASRLPHSVRSSDNVPGAVSLYRRLLANQPDRSVTIVSIGGYTNLAGLLASRPGQGSSLNGRTLVATKVKRLVIEDGLFPNGGPAFTNQKLDLAAATAVVGGAGWPTPIAWVDGLTGIKTQVGATLCTTTPPNNPMRVVYEALFGCGPPKDGDWDGPTMLYAISGPQAVFSELGQGGAAVINAQGGLSWETVSPRPNDVYVHVVDQPTLNQRIDGLLTAR
jgi:hypothetical protein